MDVLGRRGRLHLARRDLMALVILGVYSLLALSAELGANVGGQGLDPVWSAAQQRGHLRVAADFGFAPFTGMRQVTVDGQTREEPIGYDIDLAQAIGQKVGLSVEFVPTTLEAAYEDLAGGRADMVVSALPYAPEQGWRALFSTFYFNAGQVVVVPQQSSITASDQLSGRSIGVPLGSDADTYARSLAAADPTITLRADYDTPPEVLDALSRGEIDAAIVDNAAALIGIARRPGLRFVPPALTLEPYTIAVSSRAFLLRDKVNAALEELRLEGFFERNGEKWFR